MEMGFLFLVFIITTWICVHAIVKNIVWMRGIARLKAMRTKPLPGEKYWLTSPIYQLVETIGMGLMGLVPSFLIYKSGIFWERWDMIAFVAGTLGVYALAFYVAFTIRTEKITHATLIGTRIPFTLPALKKYFDELNPLLWRRIGSAFIVEFKSHGWRERAYQYVSSIYYLVWLAIVSVVAFFLGIFIFAFIRSLA